MSHPRDLEQLGLTADRNTLEVVQLLAYPVRRAIRQIEEHDPRRLGLELIRGSIAEDPITHWPLECTMITTPEDSNNPDFEKIPRLLAITDAVNKLDDVRWPVRVEAWHTSIRKFDADSFYNRHYHELEVEIDLPDQERERSQFPANYPLKVLPEFEYRYLGHAVHRILQSTRAVTNTLEDVHPEQELLGLLKNG